MGLRKSDNSIVDANWLLGIENGADVLAADFEEGAGATSPGLNHPVLGTTTITEGVWHHAAATYDGTTWNLYLDGNLEVSQSVGEPVRSNSTQHVAFGAMLDSSGDPANTARFDGALDEVRVWDAALSEATIQANINVELTSSPNLVGRWGFAEGSGTVVGDSVALAADGSIVGAGSSWIQNAPFDIVIAPTDLGALDLGDQGAYVTLLDPVKLDLPNFTVETWFRRDGEGVGGTTGNGGIPDFIPLVTHGAPEADSSIVDANWLLGIENGADVLAADFEEGAGATSPGLNHPVLGTTTITEGVWHHTAATYDGTTWNLYLDGNLEVSQSVGEPVRSNSTQHVAFGSDA